MISKRKKPCFVVVVLAISCLSLVAGNVEVQWSGPSGQGDMIFKAPASGVTNMALGTGGLYNVTLDPRFTVSGISVSPANVVIASNKVIVGNSSGAGAAQTLSGLFTISNSGVATNSRQGLAITNATVSGAALSGVSLVVTGATVSGAALSGVTTVLTNATVAGAALSGVATVITNVAGATTVAAITTVTNLTKVAACTNGTISVTLTVQSVDWGGTNVVTNVAINTATFTPETADVVTAITPTTANAIATLTVESGTPVVSAPSITLEYGTPVVSAPSITLATGTPVVSAPSITLQDSTFVKP